MYFLWLSKNHMKDMKTVRPFCQHNRFTFFWFTLIVYCVIIVWLDFHLFNCIELIYFTNSVCLSNPKAIFGVFFFFLAFRQVQSTDMQLTKQNKLPWHPFWRNGSIILADIKQLFQSNKLLWKQTFSYYLLYLYFLTSFQTVCV